VDRMRHPRKWRRKWIACFFRRGRRRWRWIACLFRGGGGGVAAEAEEVVEVEVVVAAAIRTEKRLSGPTVSGM